MSRGGTLKSPSKVGLQIGATSAMNTFRLQAALVVLVAGACMPKGLGLQRLNLGGREGPAALTDDATEASQSDACTPTPEPQPDEITGNLKNVSDDEWAKRLSPEAFEVCRKAGTEHPNTGKYNSFYASGTYTCICCGSELFSSESKYNSGSGWPAFHSAVPNALEERHDESHGMNRTEVRCAKCDAHLGHVFKDGPPPTGDRFCINSVCLNFVPKDNTTK